MDFINNLGLVLGQVFLVLLQIIFASDYGSFWFLGVNCKSKCFPYLVKKSEWKLLPENCSNQKINLNFSKIFSQENIYLPYCEPYCNSFFIFIKTFAVYNWTLIYYRFWNTVCNFSAKSFVRVSFRVIILITL